MIIWKLGQRLKSDWKIKLQLLDRPAANRSSFQLEPHRCWRCHQHLHPLALWGPFDASAWDALQVHVVGRFRIPDCPFARRPRWGALSWFVKLVRGSPHHAREFWPSLWACWYPGWASHGRHLDFVLVILQDCYWFNKFIENLNLS